MMKKIILMVVVAILLFSCDAINKGRKGAGISRQNLFVNSTNSKTEPTLFWAHYDANQRGSMLYVDSTQKVRVLAENPPDAAIQSIVGITAKVKGIEGAGEIEAAFNAQKSIAELGKRTAAVNMLRDALYRLNEMYYATVDENKETREMLANNKDFFNAFQNKDFNAEKLNSTFKSFNTFDNQTLQTLFKNIIDNAKEIAIIEANTEKEVANATSLAVVKSSEEKLKRLEIINTLISKIDGKLTKDEVDKLIKEHLKN
jgi:hypothetical protein